jgi:hypothetical protein
MHRLYSTDSDGVSFICLEYALHGYDGPNLLVIKTQKKEVIGAFAQEAWKDSIHYDGTSDCFLFQLQPKFKLLPATGEDGHFMFMHSGDSSALLQPALKGLPHGIGFGGSTTSMPRLFIPDTLENCTTGFIDATFQVGDVLPDEDLEKFDIDCLELWGVGDDEMIQHGLETREEYRLHRAAVLKKAQTVEDKADFVQDLASGLTPNKLYKHREDARGRHEFAVDEKHGGYKIDRE